MFTWEKINNPTPFNDFKPLKIAETTCYHCNRATSHAIVTTEQKEAAYWRLRYEALIGQLNSSLEDCRMLHGDDPIRIFFEKRLEKVRDELP
jgi:hypothetical protein